MPGDHRFDRADDAAGLVPDAIGPEDPPGHVRLIHRATVGEGGVGTGELERGHGEHMLTDGELHGLAGEPVAVGIRRRVLLMECLLDGRGPHVRRRLVREVDAGSLIETELGRGVLDVGRAVHPIAEPVEVHIGRHRDGLRQGDAAVLHATGIRERLGADGVDAIVVVVGVPIDETVLYRRRRRHELEGRAGGVLTGDRSIDECTHTVLAAQFVVSGLADPGGELGGIVRRIGGKGDHSSVDRTHGHHRTGGRVEHRTIALLGPPDLVEPRGQRLLGPHLDVDIDVELHIAAGPRRLIGDLAHGTIAGIDLEGLDTGSPTQFLLVGRFDAGETHRGVGLVGLGHTGVRVEPRFDGLEHLARDASHVAEDVGSR